MLTDGVHRMRGEFEHAVEDEGAALEEDVAPVPSVVLDDVVCLRLDPEVECDEGKPADPPE